MAVVNKNEKGWVLDQHKFISMSHQGVYIEGRHIDFMIKKELFDINNPFMMDSQFEKKIRQKRGDNPNKECFDSSRKSRKRKNNLSIEEIQAEEFHYNVSTIVSQAFSVLMSVMTEKKMSSLEASDVKLDNNTSARQSAITLGPGENLQKLCPIEYVKSENLMVRIDSALKCSNPYHKLMKNENCFPVKINISEDFYLIPALSSFIMGSIENLRHFIDTLGREMFDFILLDPPWENKSVKRKKLYWTLKNENLFQIPIPELSAPECLVAIWVTNRIKHINFVKEELFPFWNIRYITTWNWLKVTKCGQTICDIRSNSKKPYELLLIGRRNHDNTTCIETPTEEWCAALNTSEEFPLNMTLISVPSSLHSSKVSLQNILRPLLPKCGKCLEIFARNLTPGWVSYGNEVIKHQHLDYFQKVVTT